MIGLQDEGALVAVAGFRFAGHVVALGLRAMAHRGRAGAGLAISNGSTVTGISGPGGVDDVLSVEALDALTGPFAIGRLSGAPETDAERVAAKIDEPVVRSWQQGRFAVASAGRLTNGKVLRQQLLGDGAVLEGESDAEVVASLIARQQGRTLVNRLVATLHDLSGAWCLAIMSEDRLIVARDPRGFRPLSRGRLGSAHVFATEDAALRDLGCTEIQAVRPGEVVVVDQEGARSLRPFLPAPRAASLVDLVWLAREDARVEGESAAEVRFALGRALAEVHPASDAAVVVGLPEHAQVALGFAEVARRPYRAALRPGNPQPAFSTPEGVDDRRVYARYHATGVAGQEVCLVLPGLVTSVEGRAACEALRAAGAARIHVRIAAPIPVEPDPYGVAMPPPESWAAAGDSASQALADRLGADSAGALDLASLRLAVASWESGWCDALWSASHPVPVEEQVNQLDLFGQ